MIRSLTIDNFRCFDHFELHDLGRINLIVGRNNSGKSTLLEALDLLTADGDSTVLNRIQTTRSETVTVRQDQQQYTFIDPTRFFSAKAELGKQLSVIAEHSNATIEKNVTNAASTSVEMFVTDSNRASPEGGNSILCIRWRHGDSNYAEQHLDINSDYLLPVNKLLLRRKPPTHEHTESSTQFVSAFSLSMLSAIRSFNRFQLTDDEASITRSLQMIDPGIERIATQFDGMQPYSSRGGFRLRHKDFTYPLPIGSFGEGIWRMLSLALSLHSARDGVLLIDEIDTGLHYSVMVKMWKMVYETAKTLNIQVFATSHSRDCYEALAEVCREDVKFTSDITIQRVERGKMRAVAYSEREIVIAAERGLEVR